MQEIKVISNSSPIIVLSNVKKLELLQLIYGNIIVPRGVFDEVFGAKVIEKPDWIEVMQISNSHLLKYLEPLLHKGETEVIALAKEIGADLVIMDDYLGRKYAAQLNLTFTGTLGIIVTAKQAGIIEKVKPLLDILIENKFWIDNQLYSTILYLANELDY